jgi:hypothetical protein
MRAETSESVAGREGTLNSRWSGAGAVRPELASSAAATAAFSDICEWRRAVLDHQYRGGSRAFARYAPINSVPRFAPEGLVLGAGTVLLPADAPRRMQSSKGCEARLLTLLSAAYGRAVDPAVLGNIERAARAWNLGDDCLAYMHLAHARLGELPYPHDAVQRLLIVDEFLKAGGSPRTVFVGLRLDAPYIDALEKEYDPSELRVPSGSGKPSGEWTRGGEVAKPPAPIVAPPRATPGPASWLSELTLSDLVSLGGYLLRIGTGVGGAIATFGLLFIPSSNNIHVEGEVLGMPGLRYSWNRDEALLHFTYNAGDGEQRTFVAYVDGDKFRDEQGRVIGRLLPDCGILIDSAVASPDLVKDDEPRPCPIPGPDKPNTRGREYEDYVKPFVNPPPNTTPSAIGFQLPNPEAAGKLVYYDDCRLTTGMMVDAKGPEYDGLLGFPQGMESVIKEWWGESGRQIAASDGRPIRWSFADLNAALWARELFDSDPDGDRQRIEVVFLPWSKRGQ